MTIELAAKIRMTHDSDWGTCGDVEITRLDSEIEFNIDGTRTIRMPYDKLRKVIEIMEVAE